MSHLSGILSYFRAGRKLLCDNELHFDSTAAHIELELSPLTATSKSPPRSTLVSDSLEGLILGRLRFVILLLLIQPANREVAAQEQIIEAEGKGRIPLLKWLPVPDVLHENTKRNSSDFDDAKARRIIRRIGAAEKFEGQDSLIKAITLYQDLVSSNESCLVPVGQSLLWSSRDICLYRLANLSLEGRSLYRQLYGLKAAHLTREGIAQRNPKLLEDVVEQYPGAGSTATALQWLSGYYFERGELADLVKQWTHYARLYPRQVMPDVYTALKLVASLKVLGRNSDALRCFDLMLEDFGKKDIIVAGRRIPPTKFLDDFAGHFELEQGGNWPVFGGDNTHARRSTKPLQLENRLWSSSYLGDHRNGEGGNRNTGNRQSIGPVSIFPVIAEGTLYYQTGSDVVARHLTTGNIIWAYTVSGRNVWPVRARGVAAFAKLPEPRFVTVHKGRLYANLRRHAGHRNAVEEIMVCISSRNGEQLWMRGGNEDNDEDLRTARFVGAPIVRDGKAFASIVVERGAPHSYLVCLEAKSGKLLWKSFLGLDQFYYTNRSARRTLTPGGSPAESGGRIFLSTNLGTVAAVSAETGRVEWISTYPRRRNPTGSFSFNEEDGASDHTWLVNVPVVAEGKVLVTPHDSDYLLCLDKTTGAISWMKHREENLYLLGVRDGRIFMSGRRVYCLDVRDGSLINRSVELAGAPAGRGVVGKNYIFCPGGGQLHRVFTDNGKLGHARTWGEEVSAGHLLQVGDILVVTGRSGIDVYSSEKNHYQRQKDLVSKHPNDPTAHLELGYILLSRKEITLAVKHIREALRLYEAGEGDPKFDFRKAARELLFMSYGRLAEDAAVRGDNFAATKAYQDALGVTQDKNMYYTGTVNLALHLKRLGKAKEAVHYFQEIIENFGDFWREQNSLRLSAATFAKEEIESLLAEHGPDAYAEVEARADDLFRLAGHQDWYLRCLEVIHRYPNSRAALAALTVVGTNRLKEGRVLESFRFWMQLYQRKPDNALEAGMHVAVCFARLGEKEKALSLLTSLSKMPAGEKLHYLGDEVAFPEFRRTLIAELSSERPALPVTVPLPPFTEEWQIQAADLGIMSLSEALNENWKLAALGRSFLVAGRGGVVLLDAQTGMRQWIHSRRKGISWLGISIGDAHGFFRGQAVRQVSINKVLDEPASVAGLKAGDVILEFGGAKIVNGREQLINVIQSSPAHQKIPVVIRRDGVRKVITVSLMARPENIGLAAIVGNIAVLAAQGEVFAINLNNGKQLWKQDEPALENAFPASLQSRIGFFGNSLTRARTIQAGVNSSALGLLATNLLDKRIQVRDTRDGSILWSAETEGKLQHAPVTTDEKVLCLQQAKGQPVELVARGLWDGLVSYRLNMGMSEADIRSNVLVSDESFFVTLENSVEKRKLKTGRLLWSHPVTGQAPLKLLLKNRRLALITHGHRLKVLDNGSGRLLWKRDLPAQSDWFKHSFFGRKNFLAVANTGEVQALELTTGRLKWKFKDQKQELDAMGTHLAADRYLLISGNTSPAANGGEGFLHTRFLCLDTERGRLIQRSDAIPGEWRYTGIHRDTLVIVTTRRAQGFRSASSNQVEVQ